MLLFAAAKPNEFLLPYLIIAPICGAMVLVVGSLINAIWLRVAGTWVSVAKIEFGKAFKATLLSNFILMGFGLALTYSIAYLLQIDRSDSMPVTRNLSYWFSPITFFYFAFGSVLAHAIVFGHFFTDAEGNPLRFNKACLLSMVYLALCSVFSCVVGFITFAITGTQL